MKHTAVLFFMATLLAACGPTYSPDVYPNTVVADADWEICLMNADGSGQTRRTSNRANDWFPAWSPDGLQIAFSSQHCNN